VLVRRPEDAVVSTVAFVGCIRVEDAVRAYTRFYRGVIRLAPSIVVAQFDEVVSDMTAVIERVNHRCGTSLAPFVASDHSVAKVNELLDLSAAFRRDPSKVRPFLSGVGARPDAVPPPGDITMVVARPNQLRQAGKAALVDEYRSRDLTHLRNAAEAAYNDVLRSLAR
jgi:hypothetical protein